MIYIFRLQRQDSIKIDSMKRVDMCMLIQWRSHLSLLILKLKHITWNLCVKEFLLLFMEKVKLTSLM